MRSPPNLAIEPESQTAAVTPARSDVDVITTHAGLHAIENEWRTLATRSAPREPFADPAWSLAWADNFARPGSLFVVTVFGDDGHLSGIAPFHRTVAGPRLLPLGHRLELLGQSRSAGLLERPLMLAPPEQQRAVLRRVVETIATQASWDLAEVPLQSGQGWFEPHWLEVASPPVFVAPKTTRASVGVELPDSASALRSSFKRNLRESLRRARNRLTKAAPGWDVEVVAQEDALGPALDELFALHGSRARMARKIRHGDLFDVPAHRTFAHDVVGRLAAEHAVEALFVRVDGRRIGGLLTFLAPDAVAWSFSGIDPEWWAHNVVTLLQLVSLERAIEAGRSYADLSVGIDVSKLRWSENVSVHPEFVLVRRRVRSELVAFPFFAAAAAARLARERGRHARTRG
jgi:CelD/BcsL family acetyltransferase involved in cellulose biosynthesis